MLRRLIQLAALGALVALGWVVAPALSAQPYSPGAVDFSQPLPGLERVSEDAPRAKAAGHHAGSGDAGSDQGHADEGPVSFRSPAIAAPARFDLVGVAGEMRPLELRAREEDEPWSEWVEVTNGDPVYFGGADEVAVRARGYEPRGELHYVNVSGDATAAEAARTALRSAANDAVVAAVGLLGADTAGAGPAKPGVVSRDEWGANRRSGGCRPRTGAAYGKVKAATVHHTVTASNYSAAQAPGIVLGICRYHRNANRWNDIGYNALVDRFGTLYVGRAGGLGRAVAGAHAQGFNAQTFGLASIGTHTKAPLSRRGMRAAVKMLAWKLVKHGHTAKGRARMTSAGGSASRYPAGTTIRTRRIIGHRRIGLTACPGNALQDQIASLRRRTQRRIEASATEPPPDDSGGIGSR